MYKEARKTFFSINNFCKKNMKKGNRHFFSPSIVGVDSFALRKSQCLEEIEDIQTVIHQFRRLTEDENSLVFRHEITRMLYVAHNNEDLQLLVSLIRKYSQQKELVVYTSYQFGPDVMRLFHLLDKPHNALKLIEDESLFPYFRQTSSLLTLQNLLFRNEMYEDVIRVFEYYEKKNEVKVTNKSCYLILTAACYKLNTAEYFEKAFQIYESAQKYKGTVTLWSNLFFAALAVKQNKPAFAIESLLQLCPNEFIFNYLCMAYAQAKCFDEVFASVKSNFSEDGNKFFLADEAVSFIDAEIQKDNSNGEYNVLFKNLVEELVEKKMIKDEKLDKFLFEEVPLQQNAEVSLSKRK